MPTRLILLYRVIWTDDTGRRQEWESTNEIEALSQAELKRGDVFFEQWQATRLHHARYLDVRASQRRKREQDPSV